MSRSNRPSPRPIRHLRKRFSNSGTTEAHVIDTTGIGADATAHAECAEIAAGASRMAESMVSPESAAIVSECDMM